jgi:hypothetical protein
MSEIVEKTLQTIIVLRNDTKEAWDAEDSYILRAGEVGIGYMKVYNAEGTAVVKTVPIFKVGDDVHAWKDLPQAEGVFEKDITLTSNFGKYTTSNGFVKVPNSKGMTTTEFLMDALSQVKEPAITAPSFSLSATAIGEKEVGTVISSIGWDGTFTTGSYEYGSKKGNTTYTKAQGSGQTATYVVTCTPDSTNGTGIVVGATSQAVDGSATFTTGYTVSSTSSKTIASIKSKCTWTASDRDPLNNVGEITEGKLGVGSSEKSVSYSVTGYRKMFMGVVAAEPTAVNSAFIRGLSKVSKKAAKSTETFTAEAGKKAFYVAIPTSLTTATPTFKYKFFGEWKALAGVVTLDGTTGVEGANGFTAADYKVYKYIPESGSFDAATEIQVKVN